MRRVLAGILVGAFAVAGIAIGKSSFTLDIPHGDYTLPGNSNVCQTCHITASGSGLNVFGNDVKITLKDGKPDWKALFALDSDNDGYSNGHELGDPSGNWSVGAQKPAGTITNPANASSNSDSPLAVQRVQVPTTWAVIKALFQ
jgi:hypothetical protein